MSFLYQHLILASLPGVKAFPDPPLDFMGGSNVARAFQDHHMEDGELLHVPPVTLQPPELVTHTPHNNASSESPRVLSTNSSRSR